MITPPLLLQPQETIKATIRSEWDSEFESGSEADAEMETVSVANAGSDFSENSSQRSAAGLHP